MTDKEQKTLDRFIMYDQIHKFRNEEHKSIQWIADYLGVNFRTVKKYLMMDQIEFEKFSENITNKSFMLERYTPFIVDRLQRFQDTPAAQMHDWLKENFPDFPKVAPRTVYNFVMKVRQDYGLPKLSLSDRQYQSLPETPPGKYAQVDFGQTILRCGDGARNRVYFMAMLLCCSRYKYIWFQDKPFTSETASIAHEMSFSYFHGIPEYIIYDQDAVFLYNENLGDYRMPEVFDSYVKSRPFKVIFCRPGDPESKGKVENVVKYVKHNFLLNRQYSTLDNIQNEGDAWLSRTGNAMIHGTTCKVPYDEWCKECRDLLPYTPVTTLQIADVRKVLKTNIIKYKGNIYSLPIGTYKGEDTRAFLTEDSGNLIIKDVDGKLIAKHIIPAGSGHKVINNNHLRDRSVSIDAYATQTASLFTNKVGAASFISELKIRYPRYVRDQLSTIHDSIIKYGQGAADAALDICIRNKLYSATNFKSIISSNQAISIDKKPSIKPLGDERARLMVNFDPSKSSIDTYENLFGTL
ncbi:MAG TPA: DDE-type integrase/transposase/recombinase [Bacteroidales bacterium]|nr:DDE-type integrase/transposase/recombinase [Bacteroidales bacterium]